MPKIGSADGSTPTWPHPAKKKPKRPPRFASCTVALDRNNNFGLMSYVYLTVVLKFGRHQ